MSYQGPNSSADEYGRGYTPQQPSDPYTANSGQQQSAPAGNQYYQPGNAQQGANQYYQPGNAQPDGNQYYQPGNNPQSQQPPNYGQPPYNQQQYSVPQGVAFTTLGIDPKIESVLCYILGWVTGLIFFFLEKKDRKVRFHAMQSILFFGSLNILMVVIGVIPFINLLSPLLGLVWVASVIALGIMAYTNNPYRIPYISDYADRFTDQIKV